MKRVRLRFSLRAACLFVSLICLYLASWKATQQYGVAQGTAQRSPMPFIITEDGIPNFKLGASLTLEQERKYYFWLFGDPREIFVRELRQEWTGQSRREQAQLMKRIAKERKDLIAKSDAHK